MSEELQLGKYEFYPYPKEFREPSPTLDELVELLRKTRSGNGNNIKMPSRTVDTADDAAIADLESELKMKRDVRDDKYVALNDKRSKVGMGVAGDPAYGNDSPLYGAMGFVRKRETSIRSDKKEEVVRG